MIKKIMQPGDLFNAHKAKMMKHHKSHSPMALQGLSKFVQEEKKEKSHKKNWIAGAIKHPGALHRSLGVKAGHKIPAGKLATAAKKGGVTGKRARLAETLRSFHHKAHMHHLKLHEHHHKLAMHHKAHGDHKMHAHHMKQAEHHHKMHMHHKKMCKTC